MLLTQGSILWARTSKYDQVTAEDALCVLVIGLFIATIAEDKQGIYTEPKTKGSVQIRKSSGL